jgi:uncharacterized protein (TIGR02265 family)
MTATGGAAAEKLVYKPTFEALLKGLGPLVTPTFREELARLGVSAERLLPGYAYPVFEETVLAAAKLFPDLDPAAGCAEVGRRICLATIDANPMGKTLLPLLKLMGTARALKRAYGKSTAENYNVVTFGAETPKSLVMTMSDVGNIPDMARGSIAGMGSAMGVTLRATITAYAAPQVTFLIEWD